MVAVEVETDELEDEVPNGELSVTELGPADELVE